MSAPNTPKPITAIRFGYPFQNKQSKEITDPQEFYEGLANVQGGHYLLSPHGFFHGGIHIARASSNAFQLDEGIRCLADGEVIAYRINRRYDDATPGTAGDGPALRPYSTGFVLVRHRMQAPSPPQPPKPAPMDHPGADIRNWGTWLCEDPHGRKHLAWLRHGTPLSVEIGATGPGDSGYVRVLTTSGLGVPDQGWIKRTCLAIDPLAGTSIRNMMGLKDVVATQVYRGDTINPDAVAAHAQNKAEQELPAIAPAPTLTLYSLYMHVADFESHQKHTNWKRPPWWPVTGYRVGKKAKDRSKSRTPPAVGLNIREAPGRSPILALLLRDSVIDVGERSPDGKWARIARIVEGGIESVHADGAVPPEARHGWVFLGELDAEAVPEAFDSVVALKKPHPIKLGDVIGYLGEDVPARAYPIADQPVSRKLLHLEVFSGDDVPVYLPASRQWAKQHLEDKDRTLLLLRPGDTLLDVPNGKIAYTLNWAQVLSLTGLEVKEVDGQRWRKVAKPEFAGWIKEAGHIASSWEWPGFDVVDEQSSQSGAAWRDLAEKVGFIKKEGPHPEETPLYKALRKLLDTDGDGKLSEQELDAVLRNRSKAAHIGRLIVRHDSEWSQESATLQQQMARSIAEMLGFNALKQVEDEMPRAQKLPWWDDVVRGVEGFPASSRVYHFHPGGVAASFIKQRRHPIIDIDGQRIELDFLDIHQGGGLSAEDIQRAATELGCEAGLIYAIARQESAHSSFITLDGETIPTILYERHWFKRLTREAATAQRHPEIYGSPYKRARRSKDGLYIDKSGNTVSATDVYGASGRPQYRRLLEAYGIDQDAALQACSWGKFQIMGFNYAAAGFKSVKELSLAMSLGEAEHIKAFLKFAKGNRTLLSGLRTKNFEMIAEGHNGAAWRSINPEYANNIRRFYNEYTNAH